MKILERYLDCMRIVTDHPYTKRPKIFYEGGRIKKLILSSSVISRFMHNGELLEICPLREFKTILAAEVQEEPTVPMIYGRYFEINCIGKDVDDNRYVEFPKTKRGKYSVDKERIDQQIHVFKNVIVPKHEMMIEDKYVQSKNSFEVENDLGIELIVTVGKDLVTPLKHENIYHPAAIVDLKLTKSLNNTFAPEGRKVFSWGVPEKMDHTQAYINGFSTGLPFYYLVFDYKANPEYKWVYVNTNLVSKNQTERDEATLRYAEMIERIRQVATAIIHYSNGGWYTEPSTFECRDCPILDCPDRLKIEQI